MTTDAGVELAKLQLLYEAVTDRFGRATDLETAERSAFDAIVQGLRAREMTSVEPWASLALRDAQVWAAVGYGSEQTASKETRQARKEARDPVVLAAIERLRASSGGKRRSVGRMARPLPSSNEIRDTFREEVIRTRYPSESLLTSAARERASENSGLDQKPDIRKLAESLPRLVRNLDQLAAGLRVKADGGQKLEGRDPEVIARRLLQQHGKRLLPFLTARSQVKGPWDGTVEATIEARALGLGPTYAGWRRLSGMRSTQFGLSRGDWLEEALGPVTRKVYTYTDQMPSNPTLPPLHDFQQKALIQIEAMLQGDPGRGWLCLPTGAGKTRVVVEALAKAFAAGRMKILIWIAPSDELCEQAIEAWTGIWRAIGDTRRLSIIRMWRGNAGVVEASGPTVVVTTNLSLPKWLNPSSLNRATLLDAEVVVIDESHRSNARTYLDCLHELGLSPHETERHLIGLSATPFRSSMESDETARLANRYHRNRFDFGLFDGRDPYEFLQDSAILSRVDHALIEGVALAFSSSEQKELQDPDLPWLPAKVEQRIARDSGRNSSIVAALLALPRDWQTVVFAVSVEHAEALAETLNGHGRSAAVVTGRTDREERKRIIGDFRDGYLGIMTNFAVLATGFDAPKVRVVCIARPTLSTVLYQQMIGRGLRGPKNGGTERCLIMNVNDNLGRYGDRIAFKHFEYLWRR